MTHTMKAPFLPLLLTAFGACALVAVGWPPVFAAIVSAAPEALFMLAAALSWGYIIACLLTPRGTEFEWRLIGGIGMGLGACSLFVLLVGRPEVLHRSTGSVVLGLSVAAGLVVVAWQWWIVPKEIRDRLFAVHTSRETRPPPPRWIWLALMPFLAIALLAASFPPGTLWPAEGNGYDVLEYHFGALRDWLDAGRILYLPQNIYSNFPMNIEMLYLLSMGLVGNPVEGALTAQLINLILAILTVAAVWLAARSWGDRAAWIAAVIAASCPYLTYLCGVAYVENGLLLFAALSLAALGRASEDSMRGRSWLLLAGLFAGLACGCKYTGVPAVVLPVLLASAWLALRAKRRRYFDPLIVIIGATITFAPWLVRNYNNTGNPVFPLARSFFPERPGVWDDDGAQRWKEGHLPAPEHRLMAGRLDRLWHEIIASPLFGMTWLLVVVGAAAFVMMRRPAVAVGSDQPTLLPCWIMIVVPLICWLAFTHLVGRFAVTLIVPASIIAAVGLARFAESHRLIFVACMITAVVGNAAALSRILLEARFFELAALRSGRDVDWFTAGQWPTHAHVPRINELTRDGHRVLVVADARRFYLEAGADYCVVFNRNPFAEAAGSLPAHELLVWLRNRDYRHIHVDWSEMNRLRKSRYGFWSSINEALFRELEQEGLRRIQDFAFETESGPRVYATLYAIPPP